MSIRRVILSLAFASAYLLAPPTSQRALISGTQATARKDPSARKLLSAVPDAIRARIQTLRKLKYNRCLTGSESKATRALMTTTESCFGTIFHVLSGEVRSTGITGSALQNKLISLGYRNTAKFGSYIKKQLALKSMAEKLRAGDVIIFMGPLDWDIYNPLVRTLLVNWHAALYLGETNGQHYIFHKPDTDCGPTSSKYGITTLEQLLSLGSSRTYYTNIAVYRK